MPQGEHEIWMLGQGAGASGGPQAARPRVKMVGIGGAGLNILTAVQGFPKAAVTTSERRFSDVRARERLLFSPREVEALSTTDPSLADMLTSDGAAALRGIFADTDVAFIAGGLGGTTFGPLAPFVCRSARKAGSLALCVGVLPFSAEGPARARRAHYQLSRLSGAPHGLVLLSNDTLSRVAPSLPLAKSFSVMDHVVAGFLEDISACIVGGDIHRLMGFLDRSGQMRLTGGSSPLRRFPDCLADEALGGPWMQDGFSPRSVLMVLRGEAPEPADALELARALGERLGPFSLAYALRSVPTKGRMSATLLMGAGAD